MTREERLELLKQIEKDIYVPSIESTFLDDAKSCAIHSVIEELEQEPCEDAISRQAVLDMLEDINAETEGVGFYYEHYVEYIKKLPPVKPQESKWVSVRERLPESAFGCLVTVYDTDLRTQDEFENILPYFVGYDGETWNDADGEPIPFEVIAWMPLPPSYQKVESEG